MVEIQTILTRIADAQKTAEVTVAEAKAAEVPPEIEACKRKFLQVTEHNDIILLTRWQNMAEERERFLEWDLEGEFRVHPELNLGLAEEIYGTRSAINEMRDEVAQLMSDPKFRADPLVQLYLYLLAERIKGAYGSTKLAEGMLRDDPEALRIGSFIKYGPLPGGLVLRAYQVYDQLERGQDTKPYSGDLLLTAEERDALQRVRIDAESAKRLYEIAVDWLRLDYKVEVDPLAGSMAALSRSQTITIPSGYKVNGIKCLSTMAHELTHAREAANGTILLGGLAGGAGRCDNDILHEGHAMSEQFMMDGAMTGESRVSPLPYYTLAINTVIRERANFSDVAKSIYWLRRQAGSEKRAAQKAAWTTTYRVFRGRCTPNTRLKQVFMKDKAYLEGFWQAQAFYEVGASQWLQIGTLDASELPHVASVIKLPSADELPFPNPGPEFIRKMVEEVL